MVALERVRSRVVRAPIHFDDKAFLGPEKIHLEPLNDHIRPGPGQIVLTDKVEEPPLGLGADESRPALGREERPETASPSAARVSVEERRDGRGIDQPLTKSGREGTLEIPAVTDAGKVEQGPGRCRQRQAVPGHDLVGGLLAWFALLHREAQQAGREVDALLEGDSERAPASPRPDRTTDTLPLVRRRHG